MIEDETYQQFDGEVNVLEEKVDNAISQLDARVNSQEKDADAVKNEIKALKKELAKLQTNDVTTSCIKSEAIVWATAIQEIRLSKTWFVEPSKKYTKDNIIIGKAVVSPVNNIIPVRVLKPTNDTTKFQKGDIIAQCQKSDYVVNHQVKIPKTCSNISPEAEIFIPAAEEICQKTIMEPNGNFSKEDMCSAQTADEDLNATLKAIEKEERFTWAEISRESPITKAYWAQWQSRIVDDGCLRRIWHSEDTSWAKKLLVVPQARTSEITREYHNGPSGGHLGIIKTMEKIKDNFYWKKELKQDCEAKTLYNTPTPMLRPRNLIIEEYKGRTQAVPPQPTPHQRKRERDGRRIQHLKKVLDLHKMINISNGDNKQKLKQTLKEEQITFKSHKIA
uniref:Integrase_H2C2 domain-containing protein n=1 Tax=Glossina austeni TaxID=7395 RepID=A0A1A9V2N4_GLOAU